MNADKYVGWGMVLFGIGFGLILFLSWLRWQDIRAWQKVDQRIRELDQQPFPDPEFVDQLRADVQAAAWEQSRTPVYDRLAEERFQQQLNDPDQMRRFLS